MSLTKDELQHQLYKTTTGKGRPHNNGAMQTKLVRFRDKLSHLFA